MEVLTSIQNIFFYNWGIIWWGKYLWGFYIGTGYKFYY